MKHFYWNNENSFDSMFITSIIKAISDVYQNNDKNKTAYYIT